MHALNKADLPQDKDHSFISVKMANSLHEVNQTVYYVIHQGWGDYYYSQVPGYVTSP